MADLQRFTVEGFFETGDARGPFVLYAPSADEARKMAEDAGIRVSAVVAADESGHAAAVPPPAPRAISCGGLRFPNRCARCDAPHPDATWPVRIGEQNPQGASGRRWGRKSTANIPVCSYCRVRLRRFQMRTAVIGLVVAGFVGVVAWGMSGGGTRGLVPGLLLGGLVLALFFWMGDVTTPIARFGADGRLSFANEAYQRDFERLNEVGVS